jgi:hypothetical protein
MQNTSNFDILTELEIMENSPTEQVVEPLEMENTSSLYTSNSSEITPEIVTESLLTQPQEDILLNLEHLEDECLSPVQGFPLDKKKVSSNFASNCKIGFRFLSHYIVVSSIVFAVLLVLTNWSAYYTVAMNYIRPE